MTDRANVFTIHSWDRAEDYHRLEQLLRASDPDLAHYSLPPERALPGTHEQIATDIVNRIAFATAVVVVNTPGLHRRVTSTFEMETAVALRKRIVVVQPHGNFRLPIPAALDGQVYRYATWRSDVVGRAIRGEYPQDGRVFDLSEVVARRHLVGVLAAGVAAASFLVVVRTVDSMKALHRELEDRGVELKWDSQDTASVVRHAAGGAALGVLLGLVSGDLRTALIVAGAGAAIGAAVGVRRTYTARFLGTSRLRVVHVAPG